MLWRAAETGSVGLCVEAISGITDGEHVLGYRGVVFDLAAEIVDVGLNEGLVTVLTAPHLLK